jgi:stage II sporulation protein D
VDILGPGGRRLVKLKAKNTYHFFQDPKKPGELKIYESIHDGRSLRETGAPIPLASGTWIVPRSASFELNGKRYRGRLRILLTGNHFNCVNYLPIEEYLRGVVPHEIGHLGKSGFEALKVQAVASRTYAIQRLRDSRDKPWDMVDSIADQVYRGGGSWSLADKAIRATRGELVAIGREPAEIYYSSTCGGYTADISRVWNHGVAPHLAGVRDADSRGHSWCRSSKYFRWTHSWSAKELGSILRAYLPSAAGLPSGTKLGHLKDLRILEYSPEGRVQVLEVLTDQGRFKVTGDRIRSALKRDMKGRPLRSIMFRLNKEYDSGGRLIRISAVGAGWGHGIGLCQVGAIERSKAGEDYRRILKAYFPTTGIRKFWP